MDDAVFEQSTRAGYIFDPQPLERRRFKHRLGRLQVGSRRAGLCSARLRSARLRNLRGLNILQVERFQLVHPIERELTFPAAPWWMHPEKPPLRVNRMNNLALLIDVRARRAIHHGKGDLHRSPAARLERPQNWLAWPDDRVRERRKAGGDHQE